MSAILNIFSSPGAAFRKIKEKPTWVLPLVILILFLLAATFVVVSKMDYGAQKELAAEQMRKQGMDEERIQQQLERMETVWKSPVVKYVVNPISSVVGQVVQSLLVALVLMLMVPLLGITGGARFLLNFSVVCHAAMIRIVAAIASSVVLLLGGPRSISFGLSLLVPKLKTGFLHAFLARVNIFGIWEVVLLAMGMKIVYDLKDNRSYYYLFALWLVFTLLTSFIPGIAGGAR